MLISLVRPFACLYLLNANVRKAAVTVDTYDYDTVNGIILDIKATVEVAVTAIKALPAGAIGDGDVFALLSATLTVSTFVPWLCLRV